MYSYAYGINHKDPPQRHHRIPALSQRQFIHEWPAPLFIHIIPTLHIHIISIHYSFTITVHITGSLCSRFSLFVWDFRIQENLSNSRASHPFCISKHYSGVQIQIKTHGWTSRSTRARNRPSDTRLSYRGAEQGEEAHVSGAEAHVTVPKTQRFAAEAHVHVQRRTPLYRSATPL